MTDQRRLLSLLALIVLGLACTTCRADSTIGDLQRAQEAYDRGVSLKSTKPDEARASFAEAGQLWQAAVNAGADNASIHFNLGNAFVQAGDLGRGITAYVRAQRLAPLDRAIAANLATARSDVATPIAGDGSGDWSAIAWWRVLSQSTRAWISVVAWLAFWTAIALPFLGVRIAHRGWRILRATSLVVALVAGGSVIADRWMTASRPLAVVVSPEVVLRKGNGEGFEPQVAETLSPGIECLVLEARPGWLRIRLADGTEGWVRDVQVERV